MESRRGYHFKDMTKNITENIQTSQRRNIQQLAEDQGVKPFDFEAFMNQPPIWPDTEGVDDFVVAVREWSSEGKKVPR
jgi:hypothetical protein